MAHAHHRDTWPAPLRAQSESEVLSHWDQAKPLVSILCPTFNHELYISSALDGFLAQQSSFPFEIVVRDDGSTDGTPDILEQYAEMYPRLIRVVFEPRNTFGDIHPMDPLLQASHGCLVALCEGDDYWINPKKLELQCSALMETPNAALSVARHWQVDQGHTARFVGDLTPIDSGPRVIPDANSLSEYFHTSTYVARREPIQYWLDLNRHAEVLLGDTALRYCSVSLGPILVHDLDVSVYRVTGSGIWTSLDALKRLQWERQVAKFLSRRLIDQQVLHRNRMRALQREILLQKALASRLSRFRLTRGFFRLLNRLSL